MEMSKFYCVKYSGADDLTREVINVTMSNIPLHTEFIIGKKNDYEDILFAAEE